MFSETYFIFGAVLGVLIFIGAAIKGGMAIAEDNYNWPGTLYLYIWAGLLSGFLVAVFYPFIALGAVIVGIGYLIGKWKNY